MIFLKGKFKYKVHVLVSFRCICSHLVKGHVCCGSYLKFKMVLKALCSCSSFWTVGPTLMAASEMREPQKHLCILPQQQVRSALGLL